MDPMHDETEEIAMFDPLTYVLQFLETYGWPLLGVLATALYLEYWLTPVYRSWRQARQAAEYHKDPDKALARAQEVQAARERQQRVLEDASRRARHAQTEREEKKRKEALERLEKYGAGGSRLGTPDDGEFLPLAGGASTSSYRPPKRSACSGGGCGR